MENSFYMRNKRRREKKIKVLIVSMKYEKFTALSESDEGKNQKRKSCIINFHGDKVSTFGRAFVSSLSHVFSAPYLSVQNRSLPHLLAHLVTNR